MKSLFSKKAEVFTSVGLSAFVCILIHFGFALSDRQERKNSLQAVETILQNEISVANPYQLSKTIAGLELAGIFSAAKLIDIDNQGSLYYDTFSARQNNLAFLPSHTSTLTLQAINGARFEVTLLHRLTLARLSLEILSSVFLATFTFWLLRTFFRYMDSQAAKVQLAQYESDTLKSSAKRVKHDVSSPLSAIKLVISLQKDMNEKHKDVLVRAIARTEEIFKSLSETESAKFERIGISSCDAILGIIEEKRIIWGDKATITLERPLSKVFSIADPAAIGRIVSNLLNNSYEARNPLSQLLIATSISADSDFCTIEIQDNAKGIPSQLLNQLGKTPISFGKVKTDSSGLGVGFSSMADYIEKVGGSYSVCSHIGKGTKIQIKVPLAAD